MHFSGDLLALLLMGGAKAIAASSMCRVSGKAKVAFHSMPQVYIFDLSGLQRCLPEHLLNASLECPVVHCAGAICLTFCMNAIPGKCNGALLSRLLLGLISQCYRLHAQKE